ncbi:MAG: hypothetical protein VX764_01575 [Planctomycetota bacterium]|nr:hypothetical protein [Planctomycetota bacterium]
MNEPQHTYDLSWEMRRFALSEDFKQLEASAQERLVSALSKNQRIWFAPDDEELYVEKKVDRVFQNSGRGVPVGGQRL